ncbi:HIT domain-containing protein, partial [Desulfovibrio sp. OttesenSCG-928-O18]|nr:HIT domain-containing protein [Desulfovibrio sp. OttesenSCG-928-O18]
DQCVFCLPQTTEEDAERLVLFRGKTAFVIMNKYPYNSGHLLVVPFRHTMDYCDLTKDECSEIFALSQQCVTALDAVSKPQGFNIGFNIGAAAGAGVKGHLHLHVVPRWNGDSSFIAVLGQVRTLPEHLATTYAKLKPLFDESTHP